MPKLILKIPHMRASGKSGGLVKYIASREGVDKTINQNIVIVKPTEKQIEYIDEMIKQCPDAKDSYEYQDYIENPTRQNASAFISVAAENNPQIFKNRETYLNYIATRPKVEKCGEHGLFGSENAVNLSKVKERISNHDGVIWMPIISLQREDAARLGYDNAEAWRNLLRQKQMDIAEIFGIPAVDFKWYAAFHDEGYHPHCHMIVYSENSKRGFINEKDIEKIKSMLANEIFKNDMYELYDEKTRQRECVYEESRNKLKELVNVIKEKNCEDSPICEMLIDLSQKLKSVKGKKMYGYLPKPIKKDVDNIVKTMSEDADIKDLYTEWCLIQRKIVGIYTDKEVELPQLWENKEFKKIKNAVINEAVKLDSDRVFVDEAEDMLNNKAVMSALNLFCRLANIIDDDAKHKIDGHSKTIVDSKERRELAIKKQKLGIKMG